MRALERDRQKKDNHNISEMLHHCKLDFTKNKNTIGKDISWSYDEEDIQRTRVS